MRVASRRKAAIVFLILGICLIALTVALNVGWILLNLQQIALLVFGIIFFAIIITGLVLNTTFLVREIRRNEQHDAFLNAVTHELKTPIASLRLYLETLQTREVAEAKRQEFYGVMLADTNRLLNTVEQVLKASRAREKNLLLNISEISLAELLGDCVERVKTRYNLNDDSISFTAPSPTDAAIKVSIAVKNLNEKIAVVRIKDAGIGILPGDLKRIFKRFYRVPSPKTQKTKGTGLGLFIARSIVKKHGGRISAESRGDGTGSTFIVQLPKINGNR